jgi:hypothetical protein
LGGLGPAATPFTAPLLVRLCPTPPKSEATQIPCPPKPPLSGPCGRARLLTSGRSSLHNKPTTDSSNRYLCHQRTTVRNQITAQQEPGPLGNRSSQALSTCPERYSSGGPKNTQCWRGGGVGGGGGGGGGGASALFLSLHPPCPELCIRRQPFALSASPPLSFLLRRQCRQPLRPL